MKFRLTYEGRLATFDKATKEHKHDIRRRFHSQLKCLWETHPVIANQEIWEPAGKPYERRSQQLADRFPLNEYNFVPLVLTELQLLCRLDVLFLRPEAPGQVV